MQSRSLTGLIVASVFLLNHPAVVPGQATQAGTVQDPLIKKLAELAERTDLPGISFAIVMPDGDVRTANAGFASIDPNEEMDESSRMMSASIGKTYFSAMAVDMIMRGKLALEDPVSKYLGEFPWFEKIANHDCNNTNHQTLPGPCQEGHHLGLRHRRIEEGAAGRHQAQDLQEPQQQQHDHLHVQARGQARAGLQPAGRGGRQPGLKRRQPHGEAGAVQVLRMPL